MQMNRSFLVSALTALAAITPLIGAAQAPPETTGVEVHAGVFFPFGSAARQNATGWLAYGASYRLLTLSTKGTSRAALSISADYMGQGAWSQAPVLLNYGVVDHSIFFSAGAGFGFANEPSGTGTDFAYQGTVGFNFPSTSNATFYVMAKYWGSDRTELDGLGVYAGVRF